MILRRRFAAVAALAVVAFVAWRVVAGILEPDRHGASVSTISIDSRAVDQTLPTTVVVPADAPANDRPLLVFLHGRGADEDSALGDEFYSALAAQGSRAPVVAFPYGGKSSYWHDRADGDWARYVMREVIPSVVAQFGVDRSRVAIGGISMGGFGAYDLALHHPGRFCAIGGHSPAIWASGAETAAGAFDDAEDFARNDVLGAAHADASPFTSQPDWIDAGAQDPFLSADRELAGALRAAGADVHVELSHPGVHDWSYWNAHWSEYLRFYALALARC